MVRHTFYKIIIIVLLAVLLGGGWYLKTTNDTPNATREKTEYALLKLRGSLHSMDRYLAEALVVPDHAEQSYALRKALLENAPIVRYPPEIYYVGHSSIVTFNDIESYLTYLLTKDTALNSTERSHLKLIRKYLATMIPFLDQLHGLAKDKGWQGAFYRRDDVVKMVENMMLELVKLQTIGEQDWDYYNYVHRFEGYYPRNIFEKEEVLSEAALANKARNFMAELWDKELDVNPGGGGYDPVFGKYASFHGSKNSKMVGSYSVDISRLGGHILWAESLDDYESEDDYKQSEDIILGKMSKDEVIAYGKTLIDRWGEESLELYDMTNDKELILMTFVPIRNAVPLVNRSVKITVDPSVGKLLRFNARTYFQKYKKEAPLEPKISVDAIKNMVPQDLQITDPPKLEVRSGQSSSDVLVYAIPVEGVQHVASIFINAITGAYEGMTYELLNP